MGQPTHKRKNAEGVRTPSSQGFTSISFKVQAIVLSIVGLIFYYNTFSNEAAFDDRMAITDNEYVQKGFSGIGEILTTDAYQSYLEHRSAGNQLSGGRYRPLSLITFAVEQQILGVPPDNELADAKEMRVAHEMNFRHVVNVLLYIMSVVTLLYLFRNTIFPANPVTAFVAALLFTIHPIHTEVVANVKSRDEILSVLFISITFISFFKYLDCGRKSNLFFALLCFFLALMSKEYAVTLLLLLPLSAYIFRKKSAAASLGAVLPFLIPFGIYLLLRFSAVVAAPEGAGKDVLNNPYLYASGAEKIATKFFVLLEYLRLLLFPHPLAADYSYAAIAYKELFSPVVWLSVVIHAALAALMIWFVKTRRIAGFALGFYLFNVLLVSNFLFNIGAPMAERLAYHSSVGFCMLLAWLLMSAVGRINSPAISAYTLVTVLIVIVVLSGFKTIERNKDWKNDATLFLRDVNTVPNSALANNNAAASCMLYAKASTDFAERQGWLGKAIGYFDKAIAVYPGYMLARLNRGLCYFNISQPDKALTDWDTVKAYAPGLPNLIKYLSIAGKYFYTKGMKQQSEHKTDSAVISFQKSVAAVPDAPEVWYQLATLYSQRAEYALAKTALARALQMKPDFIEAKKLYDEMSKE